MKTRSQAEKKVTVDTSVRLRHAAFSAAYSAASLCPGDQGHADIDKFCNEVRIADSCDLQYKMQLHYLPAARALPLPLKTFPLYVAHGQKCLGHVGRDIYHWEIILSTLPTMSIDSVTL